MQLNCIFFDWTNATIGADFKVIRQFSSGQNHPGSVFFVLYSRRVVVDPMLYNRLLLTANYDIVSAQKQKICINLFLNESADVGIRLMISP